MSLMFDSLSCSLFSLPHASPTPPACTPCPQHAAPPLLAPRLFHIHGPPETSSCPMVPSSHGDPVASDHAWLELRACGRGGCSCLWLALFSSPSCPGQGGEGHGSLGWTGVEAEVPQRPCEPASLYQVSLAMVAVLALLVT